MTDSTIGSFRRETHDKTSRDFTLGDQTHRDSTPQRVLRAVAEAAVKARNEHPDQEQVVLKQAKLKRKHLPARDLFQIAPDVLTAMKPCWAMSPLVVSQVLPPKAGLFDVVVFDEASQIQPADAVGSLLRGKQAVVAGDPRQLPPTTFFLAGEGDGDDGDDAVVTSDLESVLDAMTVLLPPPIGTRTLDWHYRSRDERLITFSNAQTTLYNWSLTTFPGTAGDESLRHVLVPFAKELPGQEESTANEVQEVVGLILEHARSHPKESLGVIAMGIKHADRVAEALRRERALHPDLDAFFDEEEDEPFFVKNLERVQGDERDAIIITIGYGKTVDGRMLYRFGPINQQGGERRLNVAVTRARDRMTVVSSFTASDMDPARLRSEGPQMLQRFLQYAESGGSNLGHLAKNKPPMNPFERDVFDQLTRVDIPLVPQMGSSGYWIDFAASHPRKPGQMVLAIETDGAMYHSTPTARDRDRLRQEHLERLGWRFHRIWSTSWFNHREAEIELAKQAYEHAIRAADGEETSPSSGSSGQVVASATAGAPVRGPRPHVPRGLSISDYSQRQLVAIARWIESDTLLRTEDELLQEVMDELGFERRGYRIVDAIRAAIHQARPSSSET
jgi:very-short-patch-repair endonuclease